MEAAQNQNPLLGYLRLSVLTVASFFFLYLICGGAPGGNLFAILCVYVCSLVGGTVVGNLGLKLPPLLGMLAMGFALSNIPWIAEHVGTKVDDDWSKAIRLLALTMILCRAGLGLNISALARLRCVVASLAILPSTLESVLVAVFSVVFLKFSWTWGFMFGYVIAPISPAIVIPSVLGLQEQGYGSSTGIPSIMVASAALDDVLSLAGFGVFSSLSVTPGKSMVWSILNGPISFALGIAIGVVGGLLMAVLLPRGIEYSPTWRAGWLFCMAAVMMKGFEDTPFKGAASLAVLIHCVVSVRCWGPDVSKKVSSTFTEVWNHLAQPLLFGLVGAEIRVNEMKGSELLISLLILALSLTWRLFVTFTAVGGAGLRKRERFFVAVGWLPKATVQATIGSWAKDQIPANDPRYPHAHLIFTASVVAILLTAPAGAALISAIGPSLLEKEEEGTEEGIGAPLAVPEIAASFRSTAGSTTQSVQLSRPGSLIPSIP